MGASVSLVSLLLGSLHVLVAIPDPVELQNGLPGPRRRLVIHYAAAAVAMFGGFGFGFVQPKSTSLELKSCYWLAVVTMLCSLASLMSPGGEDDSDSTTYWRRLAFMCSEYGVLASATIAVARPSLCPS